MKMKRIFPLLASSLLIISSLSACKGNRRTSDSELVYVHSWSTDGLGKHFFSGATMGPVSWYVVEGLGDYLRTQDYVYLTTASSIDHNNDHTSIVTLRDDVKWHYTNEQFTAMDVVGYYYLNTSTLSSYLTNVEALDDTHIKYYWNEHFEPVDKVKTLLLVTDRVACAPYSVFKKYVDGCKEVYDRSPQKDYAEDKTMSPFNRVISSEDGMVLSQTYKEYQEGKDVQYFPATGPYKIQIYDANEMILEKNEEWYDKDKVGFDTIRCINSVGDASLFSSMVINNDIDLWLNTPSKPIIDNILRSNKDIYFYKVLSPYTHGVKFNMNKVDTIWSDKVRLAFQYIFDRNEVKKLACYYATTSWTPMTGMTDTDTASWMSNDAKSLLANTFTYTYDLNKATALLQEAGWTRKSGKWYNSNGLVELVIGYDGSNTVPSSVAEQIQAQLGNFGISASLKRAAGYNEFYALATSESCPYDLVCDNTSYNASYSYPSACFNEVYKSGVGATANIKKYADETIEGFNGRMFKPNDYLPYMLTYQGEELTKAVDDLVIGAAKLNYGINMFQEASGGIYNSSKIAGLPYPEKALENRDINYIPSGGTKDHIDMLFAILFYDHGSALYNGRLYPANKK